MKSEIMEKLEHICVIAGCDIYDLAAAMDQLAAFATAFEAAAMEIAAASIWENDKERDMLEALRQAGMELEPIDSLAAMAEEPADIPPPKKMPRPPKRAGPVNKANYAANRPQRRARSSCYIRRH